MGAAAGGDDGDGGGASGAGFEGRKGVNEVFEAGFAGSCAVRKGGDCVGHQFTSFCGVAAANPWGCSTVENGLCASSEKILGGNGGGR